MDTERGSRNDFTADSVISFRSDSVTAFAEGKVLLAVIVAPHRKDGPVVY